MSIFMARTEFAKKPSQRRPGACLFPFLLSMASLRIALIEIYWRITATHRYNIRSAFG
jgi:hypothetical protein